MHDITQLKAVEQIKSDFVSMVSHELRAPVTTVAGAVEMLGQLDAGVDHESYHEVLNILDMQTKRLRQVVEEVLELTRFDAGRLHVQLEPTFLQAFLQTAIERTRHEWGETDHTLLLHPPESDTQVWIDSNLLEIVFRNLFDNARKYTPPETPIEIRVEKTRKRRENAYWYTSLTMDQVFRLIK